MKAAEDSTALTLFGGAKEWNAQDWTASDDRVRGGKSQSYLDTSGETARFHGTLDIKTLGGAGFCSQRTTGSDRIWDLSKYAGIQLDLAKGDKKRYTFILKDELLPPNKDNGREQATISWEIDFTLPPEIVPGDTHEKSVFIPWDSFNPTYRGKLKKDAKPIDLTQLKQVSIMMRSFFGTQEGDFSLSIKSISALSKAPPPASKIVSVYELRQMEDGTGYPDRGTDNYYRLQIDNVLLKVDLRVHRRVAWIVAGACLCLSAYYLRRRIVAI